MKTIKRKNVLKQLRKQGSKIFSAKFVKKDGTTRDITCRLNVTRGITGKGMRYNPIKRRLLPVFDMQKDNFRMIRLNTTSKLKLQGTEYKIF